MPTLFHAIGNEIPEDIDGKNLILDSQGRDFVVTESTYRDAYEIAVNSKEEVWIEKYSRDDETGSIEGQPFYTRLFPRGTLDYSTALNRQSAEHIGKARDHMVRVGLK